MFRSPPSPRSREAYETTDLKAKLARWHNDVDNAFYGWNGAWLDPKFRAWDISDYLAYIRVPVAILQGADDQYGTIRQVEIAREECYCPVEVTILARPDIRRIVKRLRRHWMRFRNLPSVLFCMKARHRGRVADHCPRIVEGMPR